MVSEAGQCGELMTLQVPLPLDPNVLLNGIIPSSCSVFKSAMAPMRLTFRVAGETCSTTPLQWIFEQTTSRMTNYTFWGQTPNPKCLVTHHFAILNNRCGWLCVSVAGELSQHAVRWFALHGNSLC